MEKTQLVSIIIPLYNAEKWIAGTLESALAQSWRKKEIIVVNDGSTDESLKIAKRYESSITKVIDEENRGPSAARNRGLKEAQGEFIQYLDADDLLSPRKIEEQVMLLQESPPGMLAVSATIYFHDGKDPEQGILKDGWPMVDTDDPLHWLIDLLGMDGRGGMVHPGAWLTPRDVSDAAGLWNEEIFLDDDGEYFARSVLASKGIRRSKTGVSYYRTYKNGTNVSNACREDQLWSGLRASDLKAEYVLTRTNDPMARRALAISYMRLALRTGRRCSAVTKVALHRAQEMTGDTVYPVAIGGWRMKLLFRLLGWKTAIKIYCWRHCIQRSFRQGFKRSKGSGRL